MTTRTRRSAISGFLALFLMLVWTLTLTSGTSRAAQEPSSTNGTTEESETQILIGLRGEGQVDGERIETSLDPGQSLSSKVYIGNFGANPLELTMYTADVFTLINGGLGLEPEGSEQQEPTIWMTFPSEEVTLESMTEVAKEFTVTVPDGTPPGEYALAFAAETTEAIPVPGAPQLLQKIRKVVVLYITVPGDFTASFEIGEPTALPDPSPAIQIPLQNVSQTILRLEGDFTLEDSDGATLVEATLRLGPVYGMAETAILVALSVMPPAGEYRATLTLTDTVTGVTNGFEDVPITVEESSGPPPLVFENMEISANADPIQYLAVTVDILNNAETIRSNRLTLVVTKDGQPLEDFILADNLTLNQGANPVTQRYIPIDGWESGSTYEFSLRLEAVDSSGGVSLLLEEENVASVEVP
jgi:hypothetical protein